APLETSEAYRHLHEDFNLSHDEIAVRVGKSRVAVTNNLRLLNLPEPVRRALAETKISEGHARALLGLNTPQAQLAALNSVINNDLNVRQTEELVRRLSGEKPDRKPNLTSTPEISALEDRLRSALGTKVHLRHGKKGGSLTLFYYSEEELNALVERILQE
ncbi:MAG: ParB/RepB/Spo0J family partition protein, partial [Anaerolineaceae bacterium]|nr:ParB/RepB/Spo0J family partition protein [Anaerolineaceae bacterium]